MLTIEHTNLIYKPCKSHPSRGKQLYKSPSFKKKRSSRRSSFCNNDKVFNTHGSIKKQKKDPFANFSKKKKKTNGSKKPYNEDVFKGRHGFIPKHNQCMETSKEYQHFNIDRNPLKREYVRCGAIVFDETLKNVLCISNQYIWDKSGRELWGLPKGHIEKGETFSQCAGRELYEETGVHLNLSQKHFMLRINNTFYYPMVVPSNTKIGTLDSKEIHAVEWKELDDIAKIGTTTRLHNQDLKVFLKRFRHRAINMAVKNKHIDF
jgi:ADP-ribose pyrophosphatase YjhB (NUDIX family)